MLRFAVHTSLALVLALACACIRARKTERPPDAPRSIAYGYHTGLATPAHAVIRTVDEWIETWSRHHSNVIPCPPLPRIDFTREMVLFVAVGQRPTGGYGVRITRTRIEGGEMVAEARETRPPAGAIVPMVVSQPYEFVRVPRFDGNVVFETK